MTSIFRNAVLIAAVFAVSPASASQLIQNGDFSAGLTGWTSYLTANGTISPSLPNSGGVTPTNSPAQITTFDVTGKGASSAAWLNAGQFAFDPSNPAGGGIFQTFTTAAGIATFAVDIAATSRIAGDSGGIFSVLLDDVVLDSYNFGAINGTMRSSLDFTTNLTAGTHKLALQVLRPSAPSIGFRSQYFDNASLNLSIAAVPEPATWAMLVTGFGGVGFAMRRNRKVKTRVSYGA